MWNLISRKDTNELTYKLEADLQILKANYGSQRGDLVGKDTPRGAEAGRGQREARERTRGAEAGRGPTRPCDTGNQQGPAGQLGDATQSSAIIYGKGIDTCTRIAESLPCAPETNRDTENQLYSSNKMKIFLKI